MCRNFLFLHLRIQPFSHFSTGVFELTILEPFVELFWHPGFSWSGFILFQSLRILSKKYLFLYFCVWAALVWRKIKNQQKYRQAEHKTHNYATFLIRFIIIFICRSLRNEMSNFLEFHVKTSDNWTFGLKMWEPCTNLKNSPSLFWPTKTEKWHSSKFYFFDRDFTSWSL